MIFASNINGAPLPKPKKKLNLPQLDDSLLTSSVSCEFGPDGIRFVRANIKITKDGLCKITEDQILPLAVVKAEDIEVGSEIGKGASGVVEEGIYKPDNFPVAIKTINVYDQGKRRQVVNDLNIFLQDRVEHIKGTLTEFSNHLVQVFGAYYDEGSIKIIMELMDAGSLRGVLNMAKKLNANAPIIEEAYLANIAYHILEGLFYVHTKKKQIHRDIKPENILVNSLGQVKLTDFGISKQLEETQAFSKTFVGTVSYMSPERLTGEPHDSSSDIWSVGLVMIELATGEYPYKKTRKYIEMLQTIINSPEPNLPDNGLFSEEFRDFIAKCLNKDPKKRSTAAQLMEHPWLVKNSELNYDLSEWITNLVFTCKYGYNLGECPQYDDGEESGIYGLTDFSKAHEENYTETNYEAMPDNSTNFSGTIENKTEYTGINSEYLNQISAKLANNSFQQPQQSSKNSSYKKIVGMELDGQNANF